MPPTALERALHRTAALLKRTRLRGLYIGGVALIASAEPRMTQDVDLILFVGQDHLGPFLEAAARAGFRLNQSIIEADVRDHRTFRMQYAGVAIDVILSSTAFEDSAWTRRIRRKILGCSIPIPSPEDLILLKIIPGRPKDLLDARSIVEAAGRKLDRRYMRTWAERLDDEAEDARFTRRLAEVGAA